MNNLLQSALLACLVASGLIAFILLARQYLRKLAGAGIAYLCWAIVPLTLIAMLFPHRQYLGMTAKLDTPVSQVISSTALLEIAPASVWPVILVSAWMIGSLGMLLLFGMQHQRFLRSMGKLTKCEEVYLASDSDIGPALAGCFKPKIIVPANFFERYNVAEQALIIRHELVHKRRGDVIANTLCALLQCLFWFNPLIHIAARCFRLDQELACDAIVIEQVPQARRTYAEAMLKTQLCITPSTLACHWPSHHPLKERIMQLQQSKPGLFKRSVACLMLSGLCAASAYNAWAVTPASVVLTQPGQKQEAIKAGVDSYLVNTEISVGGETLSPIVIVEQGKQATIGMTSKKQQAKWDISFTLVPAPADKYKDAVTIAMKIEKDGALVAQPKLITGLNQTATLQKETPDKELDFDIQMTVNLVKKTN